MPRFRREGRGAIRILYAADLHGSETTYRKFLNGSSFYGVDALVFGGDLMGKLFVPIVRDDGVLRATFAGEAHAFDADGLSAFTSTLERAGAYWRVMDRDGDGAARAAPPPQRGMFPGGGAARRSARRGGGGGGGGGA